MGKITVTIQGTVTPNTYVIDTGPDGSPQPPGGGGPTADSWPSTPIPQPWSEAWMYQTKKHGSFVCQSRLCFEVKVPNDAKECDINNADSWGRFVVAEDPGPATPRQVTVSLAPYAFDEGTYLASAGGQIATVHFGVGLTLGGDKANVPRGQTIYFNVRNFECLPGQQLPTVANLYPQK